MKQRFFALLSLLLLTSSHAFAMASKQSAGGYTVLVVPDRSNTLVLGRDVQDRYPVLLLSYEFPGNPSDPYIHAWNNGSWTHIPNASFTDGSFLQSRPARTIVVGDDSALTRTLIDRAARWSPEVLNAPANQSAEMLNTIGRAMDFKTSDYRYFARRHGFEIQDMNARRRSESWYDQPHDRALSGVDPSLSAAFSQESDTARPTLPPAPRIEQTPASESAPMRVGPLPPARADKAATE